MNISELRRRSRSLTDPSRNPPPRFTRPLGETDPPTQPPTAVALDTAFQCNDEPAKEEVEQQHMVQRQGLPVLRHQLAYKAQRRISGPGSAYGH